MESRMRTRIWGVIVLQKKAMLFEVSNASSGNAKACHREDPGWNASLSSLQPYKCTLDKQLFKFTLARHNQPVATQGKWSFIGSAMPTYNSPSFFWKFVVTVIHIATFWSVFNSLQDCFGKVYCFPNCRMSTRPTTVPHSTTNNTTITKLDRVPHLQANAVTDQKIMVTDTDDDTQNILATAAALAKACWNIFLREFGDAGIHWFIVRPWKCV